MRLNEGKKVVYVRSSEIFNDSRATKEIKVLIDAGYSVFVLAWDRDGRAKKECAKVFSGSSNLHLLFYDVTLLNGIGLKNLSKLLGWFRWVSKELSKINNIAFIHACDLDAGFVVRRYAKLHRIIYVYDIYDYYIDAHHIPSVLTRLVEQTEIKVINDAASVIICTEERRKQISKAKPQEVVVIFNSPEVNADQIQGHLCKYDYVYCGGLFKKRLVDKILDLYPENKDLRFIFAGPGEKELVDKARFLDANYENFSYLGQIAYNQVIEFESSAACLSAIYDPKYRNHQLCAPNKYYEALGLGKPLIVCKNTGIDLAVLEHKLGFAINYNAEEFYDALRMILNDSSFSKNASIEGRTLYNNNYNWGLMKGKLMSLYNDIANRGYKK